MRFSFKCFFVSVLLILEGLMQNQLGSLVALFVFFKVCLLVPINFVTISAKSYKLQVKTVKVTNRVSPLLDHQQNGVIMVPILVSADMLCKNISVCTKGTIRLKEVRFHWSIMQGCRKELHKTQRCTLHRLYGVQAQTKTISKIFSSYRLRISHVATQIVQIVRLRIKNFLLTI